MFFDYPGLLENTLLEIQIFRWLHVLALVWWLGSEWGVFHSSTNVANPKLSLDERRRHLEVTLQIDILPRTMVVIVPLIGLHLGTLYGITPLSGVGMILAWVFYLAWAGTTLSAYFLRHTPRGTMLSTIDGRVRYMAIIIYTGFGLYGWMTGYFPGLNIFAQGEFLHFVQAPNWYAIKLMMFGLLMNIGVVLRIVTHRWIAGFKKLAVEGSTPETEKLFSSALVIARRCAYFYWLMIAGTAFIGVSKFIY